MYSDASAAFLLKYSKTRMKIYLWGLVVQSKDCVLQTQNFFEILFNLKKLCKFSILLFMCMCSNINFIPPYQPPRQLWVKLILESQDLFVWCDPGALPEGCVCTHSHASLKDRTVFWEMHCPSVLSCERHRVYMHKPVTAGTACYSARPVAPGLRACAAVVTQWWVCVCPTYLNIGKVQ